MWIVNSNLAERVPLPWNAGKPVLNMILVFQCVAEWLLMWSWVYILTRDPLFFCLSPNSWKLILPHDLETKKPSFPPFTEVMLKRVKFHPKNLEYTSLDVMVDLKYLAGQSMCWWGVLGGSVGAEYEEEEEEEEQYRSNSLDQLAPPHNTPTGWRLLMAVTPQSSHQHHQHHHLSPFIILTVNTTVSQSASLYWLMLIIKSNQSVGRMLDINWL